MSVVVTHLSKRYGTQKAVDNISFSISKGEIVGFLGPNGAGKSTTMKMITGYLEADSGSIELAGMMVNKNALRTKKKTGYLPESNPLYPEMYVREYLGFVAGLHGVKTLGASVEAAIATTGLVPEANKKIGQLSKGYKQRVGLAAALIHDPEVLILDEPTTGLDPNQITEIREVIRRLGNSKTVLFSSHILQEVQALCDRVIIINRGVIVADDKLVSLQKSPGGHSVVIVIFEGQPAPALFDQLENATGIDRFEPVGAGGQTGFRIHTVDPESIRRQVMEMSLKNRLNIVSLQSESNSLESIFKTLTQEL